MKAEEIDKTYLNLSVHERINARSGCLIDRSTGLAGRRGRFERELGLNNHDPMFYDQPCYLRPRFVSDKKFTSEYNVKF